LTIKTPPALKPNGQI